MKTLLRRIVTVLTLLVASVLAVQPARAVSVTQGLALDPVRNLIFTPVGDGAVHILDVSDPTHPELVSDGIQSEGVVQDLHYDAATQQLYIAAETGGLEIWDVGNPASPQLVSVTALYYFGVEAPAVSVDVSGDYAYVSTAWGYLHWLNVSDPTQPVDFGFNGQGGNPSREVQIADDGLVYLAGPDTIRYVINPNGSLSSAGMNIYANSYEIFAASGYVYIVTGTGPVGILDAGRSALPFISTYDTNNIKDIFTPDNYAYLAHGTTGLRILDVTDRSNPYEIGFEDSAGATDVVVSGGYAYVRAGNTLRVVDVSVPASPVVVGLYEANGGGSGNSNTPPVADAGPDQSVKSRARVNLDGSASYDPDGTIASFDWNQLSGPAILLKNADTATPFFKAPKVTGDPVNLVFELIITDDDGASATSEVTITVLPTGGGGGRG